MQAAVILAGGRFARFGRDKNLAPFGGKPLIWYAAQALTGAGNVIIVANNWAQAEKYLKIVGVGATAALDPVPSQGTAGALLQGLRSTYADNVAVAYSDTPFIVWGLYCLLYERAVGHDGAVVEVGGARQYNIAVYRRLGAIKALKEGIEAGRTDMAECLAGLDLAVVPEDEVRRLDPKADCLHDVDTNGDLLKAAEMLARREREERERRECEV
jgi:molybdopterin-guanine dinucleotide biosynthesis protein A